MGVTSQSLLQRLRTTSDSEAWQRLVDLYGPFIRRWLHKQGTPATDAEDLVQEVLAVVVRELPKFEHNQREGAFRSWLRGITLNKLRGHWRAKRTRPAATGGSGILGVLQQLEDESSELSRQWDREHDEHVLRYLLRSMEDKFEETTLTIFRRVTLEGASVEMVAEELDVSVASIYTGKSRVLRYLRQEAEGLVSEGLE